MNTVKIPLHLLNMKLFKHKHLMLLLNITWEIYTSLSITCEIFTILQDD